MSDFCHGPLSVHVIEDMRILLDDGVSLSARVWMPDEATGKVFPAVIEYIPYRKSDGTIVRDEKIHPYIAEHGYVCLRIDLRGSGDSEGLLDDEYSATELDDACQVINWIAAQPWCSGSVGMMGKSWGGFNALQTAVLAPPALKAVVSGYTTTDRFADDIHYKGGCLLGDNLRWGAVMLAYSARPPDPLVHSDDWRDMWLARLAAEPFLSLTWLAHQRRDDYWRHGSVCESYETIRAAVLVFAGWADNYMNAPFYLLENLNRDGRAPVRAIIGPWGHQYPHMAAPEPRIDFLTQMREWWDCWLKGQDTGADKVPVLRYFQQESVRPQRHYHSRPGIWRAEHNWPTQRVRRQKFYLTCAHELSAIANTRGDLDIMVSSPQHCGLMVGEYFPMALATDDHSQPGPPELPGDQRADDALSVCFETDVLSEDVAILGAANLTLNLFSATRQGQIFVRLCDVHPDGASTRITHGMLNLAHRDSSAAPESLEPNQRYDICVHLDQMSYVLPKGHRLRLALSTAYFPFVWPSPEQTVLSLYSGCLDLPVHKVPHSQLAEISFNRPESPPGWQGKTLRTAHYNRKIDHDLATGRVCLTITTDSGRTRDNRHGLITDTQAEESWSVHCDDPLTAEADIKWIQQFQRKDWQIDIRTGARMTSDKDNFFLTGYIKASENGNLVFERMFEDVIARDNR